MFFLKECTSSILAGLQYPQLNCIVHYPWLTHSILKPQVTLSDAQGCIVSILVYSTLSSSPFLTHKGVFFPYWSTVHSARHPFWHTKVYFFHTGLQYTQLKSPFPTHKGVFFPYWSTVHSAQVTLSDSQRCIFSILVYSTLSSSHPFWHTKVYCFQFHTGLQYTQLKSPFLTHKGVLFPYWSTVHSAQVALSDTQRCIVSMLVYSTLSSSHPFQHTKKVCVFSYLH